MQEDKVYIKKAEEEEVGGYEVAKKMRRRRERRKDKGNAETDYINELKEGRAVMGEERIWIGLNMKCC